MSKTLYGDKIAVLEGSWKSGAIDDVNKMGTVGVPYTIGKPSQQQSGNIYTIINNGVSNEYVQLVYKNYGLSREMSLTSPSRIPLNKNTFITVNAKYVNSISEVVPDLLFDFFDDIVKTSLININVEVFTNTDGQSQNVLMIRNSKQYMSAGVSVNSNITFNETTENLFSFSTGGYIGGDNKPEVAAWAYTGRMSLGIKAIVEWTNTYREYLIESPSNEYYPHAPTLQLMTDARGRYLLISTNVPAHGNIYYNGGEQPETTYTTARTGPFTAKYYITKTGTYTANVISEVAASQTGLAYPLYAYSALSSTVIVNQETVDIAISFNEYTGELTATAPIGSCSAYKLMKLVGQRYSQVDKNDTGIFKITESGTYRIEGDNNHTFMVNPSESITVETTLDTPTAVIDYSNPSQLGIEEVENANAYDVYKLDENGEPVLYTTVSSQQASRMRMSVKRELKLFNLVVKE